jgi:hypothetical protein
MVLACVAPQTLLQEDKQRIVNINRFSSNQARDSVF